MVTRFDVRRRRHCIAKVLAVAFPAADDALLISCIQRRPLAQVVHVALCEDKDVSSKISIFAAD